MLTGLEKILFVLLVMGSLYYGGLGFYHVYKAILRGRPDDRFENLGSRILRSIWIVLTQESVFKRRPIVSFLHALIFYGFLFYFLVNLVDILEGYFALDTSTGAWRPFNLAADLFTAGVLVGMIGLIIRRRLIRPQDFRFPPN